MRIIPFVASMPMLIVGLLMAQLSLADELAVGQEAPSLDALLKPVSQASTGISSLRLQMLTDAGRTVGFRGGLLARTKQLRESLQARGQQLDTLYNFTPLMSAQGSLPPVIVRSQDIASISSDQIRTADRSYSIEREERFVSVPPTWRDYLYIGLNGTQAVDLPQHEVRPKNDEEAAVWQEAVKAGWSDGQRQAEAILQANFNRLTRDYGGMVLYAQLRQKGMVSQTKVAESQQTVTGDGQRILVGETSRRIAGRAQFDTNPDNWRPVSADRVSLPGQARLISASLASIPASEDTDTLQIDLQQTEAGDIQRGEADKKAKEEALRLAEAEQVKKAAEAEKLKQAEEAKRREVLTLRVADGQWLPDAISIYLSKQQPPMDLEWNAPSQFRLERGLAVHADQPEKAIFNVVRNYGLSICVHRGNVKPVVEVYPAGSEEEKCRD
ncbi:hypothetical protein CEK28_03780 [Xenophilus sp. AP218F]|nr:hypothetical protein CEK28_03780 [Xenophilus sp. AP218F]